MGDAQRRECIRFGPFSLSPAERRFEREGEGLTIGGRALDLLIVLVERAGEVVCHRELINRVWQDVIVDDSSLRVQVATLRKALGDGQSGARYITNVPGRGYAFVAPIAYDPQPMSPTQPNVTSAPDHGLPPPPPYLIGRDEVIERIGLALTTRRLVTIVGTGGIGKTTIAAAVGRAQLLRFKGAIRFIDLAALNEAHLVAGALAAAFGLPVQSRDPMPALIAFLQDRRMLLVLDGCEHVIETVAAVAERVIQQTREVYILATSREALRVAGEQVHRVEPLPGPPGGQELTAVEALRYPAAQLFVARVSASRHDFHLRDKDAPMVAEICRRLDGIALAIELVAGRIEAYGILKTSEMLNAHLELLWRGRRTAVPRHQTMSAAIDWSYNLLSDLERLGLCRLAAFAGPFELHAAEHILVDGLLEKHLAIEIIAKLVGKSLVAVESAGQATRYRLFDTTRAYLLPKLFESGEADKVFECFARYWLAFLERADAEAPRRGSEGFVGCSASLGNIRAALDWSFSERGNPQLGAALAAVVAPLFLELSLLNECYDWTKRGISALPDSARDSHQEMKLLAGLGLSSMVSRTDPDEVRTALTRGLNISTRLKDNFHQLRFLGALHLSMCRTGDFRGALAAAQRCASVAKKMADPAANVMADSMLAAAYHLLGDLMTAQRHGQAALSCAPASQRMHTVYLGVDHRSRALCVSSRVLWLLGFADQALEAANFMMDEASAIDHPVTLGVAFWTVPVFIWMGQLTRAETMIKRLLVHAGKFSLQPYCAMALGQKGTIAIKRGDPMQGVALLKEALIVAGSSGYAMVTTGYMNDLAEGLLALGQPREALQILDQSTARIEGSGELYHMSELLRLRGEALDLIGSDEAESTLLAAIERGQKQQALALELRAATSLLRVRCKRGHPGDASGRLASVYGRFSEGFGTFDLKSAAGLLQSLGCLTGVQTEVAAKMRGAAVPSARSKIGLYRI
jgi:predicted ATPase/DNA-binding winged helix-turn-helix (wHTH) protein